MSRLPTMAEELAKLEREDPAVKAAAEKYDATVASILAEQPTLPLGPRIRLTAEQRQRPVAIWGICKAAALEADWSLRRWVEFKKTTEACLEPLAKPESMALFMRVVEERFDVT